MSLDVDANNIVEYCPLCGEELLIRIGQAVDIWNEKKEIKRKDIKYVTNLHMVKTDIPVKKKRKPLIDIRSVVRFFCVFWVAALIVLVIRNVAF